MGLPTWEGDYMKTIVQIMSLLGRNNRVLYVDYPFTYKDVLYGILGKNNSPWRRVVGQEPRLRQIATDEGSKVHVLTLPPVLPTNWLSSLALYKKIMQKQSHKVRGAIQEAAETLGMQNPVVINAFNPFFGLPLAGKLNERVLLYYCYDEIKAAEWCSKHGGAIESEFLQKIDGVITTSQALFLEKRKSGAEAFLVKNGVNYTLFNKGFTKINPAADNNKIGYLGSVDDRLDTNLLIALADKLPHLTIEVVGRIVAKEVANKLAEMPNIKLVGSSPPASLPKFLATWSVGLIPFVRNEFTKNIYPLKINEYLAAGLPVVMTPFAQLEEFNSVVRIEGVVNDFVQAVVEEIANDSNDKRLARAKFARQNSWENRVNQLELIIDSLLSEAVES